MIIKNAAFCKRCATEIESHHRHDFRQCPCGNLFVDGGKAYLRRGFESSDSWEERSEHADGPE